MYNIVEKPAEAKDEASATRTKLAELVAGAVVEVGQEVKAEDKATKNKAERSKGKEALFEGWKYVQTRTLDYLRLESIGISEAALASVRKHETSWRVAAAIQWATTFRREHKISSVYFVEGIVQGARQLLFQQKVKLEGEAAELLQRLMYAPALTSIWEDHVLHELATGYSRLFGDMELTGFGYCMAATTENGVAFLHGFKSEDDSKTLRWTSARAGAVAKELTGSDAVARIAADELRGIYNYTFDLHPNDCDFGAVYESFTNSKASSGLGSCMAGDGIAELNDGREFQPCTAYSSALHGSGDNGLVLVVAKDAAGIQIGRGILNVHNNKIVRWYGEHKTLVQLHNVLGLEEDSAALHDSWLVLLHCDGAFIAPYVDGDYDHGDVCESTNRVYLGCRGVELSETRGYAYIDAEEKQQCCYDDEYYRESDMTWQPESETWIHDDNIHRAYTCAITGEHFHSWDTQEIRLRGEMVLVWEGVDLSDGYTDLGGDIGWVTELEAEDYEYDEVTERWYHTDDYAELIAEREAEEAGEEDAA